MKLYITYLWFDIWACVCPDVPHGAFLNREDARKLALDNFNAYREHWKDMDDFEITQETPDRYGIGVDHGFFTSYVEECELDADNIDLSKITDNNTTIYFVRPDITTDKPYVKPYEVPYMAFTSEEKGKQYVDKWFKKYAEIAKNMPDCKLYDDAPDDKSVYYEKCYAKFYLDETRLVTNLDEYLKEGKKNETDY